MAPDELLRLIRLTIKQMDVDTDTFVELAHGREVAEYFEQLDEWLSKDGILPNDWLADEDKQQLCTVEHGDWTGPHVRISSCPEVTS